MQQTIVALATPTGRSGIGVVRLSGAEALSIARRLAGDTEFAPPPRTAVLCDLHDTDGEVIDRALVTWFQAPRSFTGEDVVEVNCHGSPVLLRQVIDLCLSYGARLAEAGEFTLRALGNGRLDLVEAEAIRDLIDAETKASARQAVRQLRGEFSNELKPLKDELLNVIVILESALEFVEDDLPELQANAVADSLERIGRRVTELAATFEAGRLVRNGLRVALAGRPNVGKSSLFNTLLGSERAIVTELPGTTRDHLHERFTVGDVPVSLIDTAGLRTTEDVVESIGVERSRAVMADADLVIVIVDAKSGLSEDDLSIIASVSDIDHFVAVNKIDLVDEHRLERLSSELLQIGEEPVNISALAGDGLDDLRHRIVGRPPSDEGSGFLITDARHHDLLVRSAAAIDEARSDLANRMSEEIVLIGLHNSLRYLGEITGETTTEDVLGRIFSTFCIGK